MKVASRTSLTLWMAVGVVAISTSPILIRVAAMPALALAFWRCLAGAAVLAPFAPGASWAGWPADLLRLAASGCSWPRTSPSGTPPRPDHRGRRDHPGQLRAAVRRPRVGVPGGAAGGRAWAGIVLATAGAVVIGLGDAAGFGGGPGPLLGDVLAFAGALAMAAYLLLGRVARQRLPVSTYAASVYGVAAAVLLPACLLTGSSLGGYPAASWLALAGVVAGPQLLGHTVFNGLLATVSATVVAVVLLLEPVVATLLAWWLLDELPGPSLWAGGAMVLAGVWLATTGSRRM